jgi:hypothetical protein
VELTSYIIGDELRRQHAGGYPFDVAWLTIIIVRLPAEALMLGERFTIGFEGSV